MKSSSLLNNQKGISALILLLTISLASIVALQVKSLVDNKPATQSASNNAKPLLKPVVAQPAASPQAPVVTPDQLRKYLVVESALLGVSDNISLYFKDLSNTSEISLEPTKSWIPASTIKAFVLLEAFRQKRLGLINFSQEVTIKPENVVPTELETDEFPRLREGTQATIEQLVDAMIIQSDNTAYNSLIDILDRRNINNSLRSLGITETVVGEKLNLDGDQFQRDLAVPGRQPNTTTVKDYADFYTLLYNGQVPNSDDILAILKRQKINNMIPAKLPDNTVVAHKTGDWAPIYHDGGIIYKPDDPFVFVVFSNSGDPAIIAKLAQVAYYQDSSYVGKNLSLASPIHLAALPNRPTYYDDSPNQVLGETAPNKFPVVTAEDLGITSKDLMPSSTQVKGVQSAWILPGSLVYGLQKIIENVQLNVSTDSTQKTQTYLDHAKSRLSEIKSLLNQGDTEQSNQLLAEGMADLKNATIIAHDSTQKDNLLVQIKNVYDLYYAVMDQVAPNLQQDQKSQFVDSVYSFYQKGKTDILPVVNTSVIATPTQQKPTIGVIDKVSSNQMTVKFEDGSTKQVNISSGTNVRAVDQETSESVQTLEPGNKVAIIGPTGENNTISAQFVLNNIPQGLTDQHEGTVASIDSNQNILKIIDQKGQVNLVKIDNNTSLKSTDTNISLEGIKTGSQVVVFGVPISSSSAQLSPSPAASVSTATASSNTNKNSGSASSTGGVNPSVLPVVKSSTPAPVSGSQTGASTTKATVAPTSKPTVAPAHVTPTPTPVPATQIKATSVTVVGNSSGKTEKTVAPPVVAAPAKSTAPASSTPPKSNSVPVSTPAVQATTAPENKSSTKK